MRGIWGSTQLTARGMVRFYRAVHDDPKVWPWLLRAMHAYTQDQLERRAERVRHRRGPAQGGDQERLGHRPRRRSIRPTRSSTPPASCAATTTQSRSSPRVRTTSTTRPASASSPAPRCAWSAASAAASIPALPATRTVVLDPGHNGGNSTHLAADQPAGLRRVRAPQAVQHHRHRHQRRLSRARVHLGRREPRAPHPARPARPRDHDARRTTPASVRASTAGRRSRAPAASTPRSRSTPTARRAATTASTSASTAGARSARPRRRWRAPAGSTPTLHRTLAASSGLERGQLRRPQRLLLPRRPGRAEPVDRPTAFLELGNMRNGADAHRQSTAGRPRPDRRRDRARDPRLPRLAAVAATIGCPHEPDAADRAAHADPARRRAGARGRPDADVRLRHHPLRRHPSRSRRDLHLGRSRRPGARAGTGTP